ncbi:11147_t:CDS:2, partial [Scutellospora calospora]
YFNERLRSVIDDKLCDYNEFGDSQKIDEGAFGKILKTQWRNKTVVLKTIKFDPDEKSINKFINELQHFQTISHHPNIIHFYGITIILTKEYSTMMETVNPTDIIGKIEQGFIFKDRLIKNAIKSAFKVDKDKIQPKLFNYIDEQRKICNNELDNLCNKNLISYGEISTILPWLSIFLGMSKESSKKYLEPSITTEILVTKLIRAEVIITKECLNLSENFERDINGALESCNKIDNLRKITENYGYFYARRIVFGGAIIKELNTNNSIDSNLKVINGDDLENNCPPAELTASLEHFKNWKIIEYSDIYPIFDILGDNLRKKVLDVLGYRILK